jgi:hypothetical protein
VEGNKQGRDMGRGGGIVGRRKAYEGPKSSLGDVSRRSPGTQQCVGCAGARASTRQKFANPYEATQ